MLKRAFPKDDALEAQIVKDLEFVRNAIFTEPSDQSAWLYQRFLLGDDIKAIELLSALLIHIGDRYLRILKFNQKVKFVGNGVFSDIHTINVDKAGDNITFEKSQFLGNVLGLTSGDITVDLSATPALNTDRYINLKFTQTPGNTPIPELSTQPDSVWMEELKHIEELVEIEPDSKWALLTLLEIYQHLGKESKTIVELLERLIKIDPFRIGYYVDIKSDIQLQTKLEAIGDDVHVVDLSGLGLTRLHPHLSLLMAKEINLSDNLLSKIDSEYFLSVKKLNLDNNRFKDVDGIQSLANLEHLSLQNNRNLSY